MPALITNFGPTRAFPTAIGNIHIPHGGSVHIDDEKAAREIEKWPLVAVKWAGRTRKPARPSSKEFASIPINLLRSMAARAGFKGVCLMKKSKIIALMEE